MFQRSYLSIARKVTTSPCLALRSSRINFDHAVFENQLNSQRRGFAKAVDWHGTTILCVRKDGHTVMGGDGQVSQGSTVVKGTARKVRKLGDNILVGFAGSTADALTLLERLEKKLEEHPGQLTRACVDLAKAWRTEKYLRHLEVRRSASCKSYHSPSILT